MIVYATKTKSSQNTAQIESSVRRSLSGITIAISVTHSIEDITTHHSQTQPETYECSLNSFQYKLCKVKLLGMGPKKVPFLVTHDGRTIRYPDPMIKVNDSVQLDIATGKITDHIRFESGNLIMVTGGRNLGRVGTVVNREKHPGSFEIVHVKDANGHLFATRLTNVFIIGKGTKTYISLPKGKGIKLSVAEERDKRMATKTGTN